MDAGAIELKMTLLTGMTGGVLLAGAELLMLHKKVARYRNHLRSLRRRKQSRRLTAEITGIALVFLAQSAAISVLTAHAMGNFLPAYEQRATQQLEHGGAVENRPLRGGHDD